ncbi:acyltransferase family protein [Bradyrhizobium sp. 930_D9_N1_4]|uniref:acyltransferase family protein n=1 Tax=Bradyrhizobium sp. 930_D9_N1_4 TaxID=3240374 RepID=UPI003F8BD086
MEQRSPAIDYLRAFAVLWVVLYHFCSISIFKTGYYGVVLFFAISGYCITISAASAKTPWQFYAKRLGRLMPALVVCSLITVAFKHLAPHLIEQSRLVPWREMFYSWIALPTLNLPGSDYLLPDNAYWSLIVEFKFYVVVFAILLLGLRNWLLPAVCAYAAISMMLARGPTQLDFYSFFIAGIAVAELRNRPLWGVLGIVFAFGFEAVMLAYGYTQPSAPITLSRSLVLWLGTAALVAASFFSVPALIQRVLKPMAYVGLVSYPLYLIHQDAGKMVLNAFGIDYSDAFGKRMIALFVVPAALTLVAGIIHALVEKPLIKPLSAWLTSTPDRDSVNSEPKGVLRWTSS